MLKKKKKKKRGAWVAQSVKRLTLDFSSGHDLTVRVFEPLMGLRADGEEPAWNSLSPPHPPQNKQVNLEKKSVRRDLQWKRLSLFVMAHPGASALPSGEALQSCPERAGARPV